MRVRDLGTLLVELGDDVLRLGNSRQAALLARLAMEPNRPVASSALKAAAWGSEEEVSAASLDSQLWRLRNRLEPHRGGASSMITRDGSTYRLQLDPSRVDSAQFEQLSLKARQLAHPGSGLETLAVIDEALALWRGRPYEPIALHPDIAPAVARLEERRDQLLELRISQLLQTGNLDLALADLTPMVAATPFRERLWELRLRTLAELGRVEEALVSYQDVRRLFRDELGIDLGTELQTLHTQLLTRTAQPSTGSRQPTRGPHQTSQMPRPASALIGRSHDFERLTGLLRQRTLVTITGPGGCGKTSLAIQASAAIADTYPDGTYFVDLTAITDNDDVADLVASRLGLAVGDTDFLTHLRAFARDRRLLVILDNCEHVIDGAAQCAEALTADDNGPFVLATSREPLNVAGEFVWSLAPLSLLPTSSGGTFHGRAPAVELFLLRATDAAPDISFDSDDEILVQTICEALDGLPLAIELAAARIRSFSLPEIAEQVRTDPTRLGRLGRTRGDHRANLFSAIEWSYRLMPPDEQTTHRRLSVLPGSFTAAAAHAVMGSHDVEDVPHMLATLVHQSMLAARPHDGNGTSTFVQLATVRAHARRRLHESGERDTVLARRDEWVTQLIGRRPRLGRPEAGSWYDDVESNYPTVHATLNDALNAGHTDLLAQGSGLAFFWFFRSRAIEGCNWLAKVVSSGQLRPGSHNELIVKLRLAGGQLVTYRPALARAYLTTTLARVDERAAENTNSLAEALVCAAGGAWASQAFDLLDAINETLHRVASHGDHHIQLFAAAVNCVATRPSDTEDELARRVESLYGEAMAHGNLVAAWFLALKRCVLSSTPAATLAWTQKVIDLHRWLGPGGSRPFLETLANAYAVAEEYDAAVPIYAATAELARQTGTPWPLHAYTGPLFATARREMDTSAFERAWIAGSSLSFQEVTS